jgi:two-component sensor histidine kinase
MKVRYLIIDIGKRLIKTDQPVKGILFGILLLLSVSWGVAQNSAPQSPNELLLAIQKSKPDTNRIRLQLKLGYYYLYKPLSEPVKFAEHKHNLDSAINLFNQALQLSISLHETDWQYSALDMITEYDWQVPEHSKQISMWAVSYYHPKSNISSEADAWQRLAGASLKMDKFRDDVLDKIGYYQHARSLYLQNHQLVEAAGDLSNIANLRILIQQYDPAEKDLQQSLAEYKASGYKKLHYIYSMLVNLEYSRGNYYRAIAYCLQGIKNTAVGENVVVTSRFYWNAARCNYAVKKYQEALNWIRKAVEIDGTPAVYRYFPVETLLALNKTEEALKMLNDIAKREFPNATAWDTLNRYKCLALYYAEKNNSYLAVQYYLKTLKIAKKYYASVGSTWDLISDNGIAAVYLKATEAIKAEKYIKDAALKVKNAKMPLDPELLVDLYDNSYKYDVATGNYVAAVKNLEQRVKLQDSLFSADKDKQLTELNIQYQTAQEEQSIKSLNGQSAEEQARMQTANLQRNITIIGIVIMMLVSALFYRNYKQKQAANDTITKKNELLQHLLNEKEWLLKEVHHRVKNNLHTVICLLESQARYLENDALVAMERIEHRIYAMSLIHQKLYQSDDLKTINMANYIIELIESLEESFGTSERIQFARDIEPINLSPFYAIPLGLIINEAVTNSIKYAFPDYRKGEISVSMISDGKKVILELTDNGIGMPPIDRDVEPESLGLRLIKGLSDDIDAEISFKVGNGTSIVISFKPNLLNDHERFLKFTNAV